MDVIKDVLAAFLDLVFNGFTEVLNGAMSGLRTPWIPLEYFTTGPFSIVLVTLKATALTILSICIMLEFVSVLTRTEMLKIETVIMAVGKYVLSVGIIDAAPGILMMIFELTMDLNTKISHTNSAVLFQTLYQNLKNSLNGFHWFELLASGLFIFFIPLLVILIASLIIKTMVYGIMFEVAIYFVIAPIPCAFLPYNEGNPGFSHITIKFFKGFAAVCLQGTLMTLCLTVFDVILSSQADTFMSINVLLSAVTGTVILLTIAVTKCGSWAKSIMDAA